MAGSRSWPPATAGSVGSPSLVFSFGHHGITLDDLTRWRLHRLVGDEAAERLVDGRHVLRTDKAQQLSLFDARHDSWGAFEHTERARAPERARGGEERYLDGLDDLPMAVRRAAAPMLAAFTRAR